MSFPSSSADPKLPSSSVNSAFKHRLPRLSSASLTKTALGAALGVGVLASGSAQASLVLNGGFENGLNNWSCTTSFDGVCTTSTNNFGPAPEGTSYFVGYDNYGPGTLSQTLTTVAGKTYDISFLFNSDYINPYNEFSVQVGSLSHALDMAPSTWTTYSGTFTAASSSTPLNFLFKTGFGSHGLDNVVVTEKSSAAAVPGPLPLFGAGAAFAWSRRLRKRIAAPMITPPEA